MVDGKAKIDMHNGLGEVKAGDLCTISSVWLNSIIGDIYVRALFGELEIITSIKNIELDSWNS